MTIWTILADAVVTATARHMASQGEQVANVDLMVETIKAVIKDAIPDLLKEWGDMVGIRMSEQQLRWAVNIQANSLAAQVISRYRETITA